MKGEELCGEVALVDGRVAWIHAPFRRLLHSVDRYIAPWWYAVLPPNRSERIIYTKAAW